SLRDTSVGESAGTDESTKVPASIGTVPIGTHAHWPPEKPWTEPAGQRICGHVTPASSGTRASRDSHWQFAWFQSSLGAQGDSTQATGSPPLSGNVKA